MAYPTRLHAAVDTEARSIGRIMVDIGWQLKSGRLKDLLKMFQLAGMFDELMEAEQPKVNELVVSDDQKTANRIIKKIIAEILEIA